MIQGGLWTESIYTASPATTRIVLVNNTLSFLIRFSALIGGIQPSKDPSDRI